MKFFLSTIFTVLVLVVHTQPIDRLFDQAETSISNKNWNQAISEFSSILEDEGSNISSVQRANIFNNLGFAYLQLEDYANAEYHLKKAIDLHENQALNNVLDYTQTLQNLGLLYKEVADFDLAFPYLQKAISLLSENSDDPSQILKAKANLGQLYEEAGQYSAAHDVFTKNYQVAMQGGEALASDYASCAHDLGRILLLSGKPVESEPYLNQSIDAYNKLGSAFLSQKASVIETLALYNEKLGNLGEAERNLLEVLRIKRSSDDDSLIDTMNNLGILYQRLGNLEKARNTFDLVVQKSKEKYGSDHPYYATSVNNLATIALGDRDYLKAKTLLEEALKIYESIYGKEHPLSSNTLNNLARVERYLGNFSSSESYYRQVLKIDERVLGKDHPDYATTLLNLGILLSITGNEAEAEELYLECIGIRMSVLGQKHPAFGSALETLGMHYLAVDNLMEAEIYFRVALEIQVSQLNSVFPILTEEERELFYQTMKEDLERYNFIAFSLLDQNPDLVKNIFDFQLKTKAILFNSSKKVKDEVDNSDEDIKETYNKWQRQKKLLSSYHAAGVFELKSNNIDISLLEEEVKNLEKELAIKLSQFETLFQNESENWQAIQTLVKPNEAIVELIRIREFKSEIVDGLRVFGFTDFTQYLAIILDNSTPEVPKYAVLGDEYKTENDWYNVYRNSFIYNVDQSESFKILWQPIHDKLTDVNHVRVSPDGIFFKMNPNTLQMANKEYLIENYFVSYVTSCKDLFRKPIEDLNQKAFLFGNPAFARSPESDLLQIPPLPGSEEEINKVAEILNKNGWESKIYIGPSSTETSLRSSLNPTVLHIATHGYFGQINEFISSMNQSNDPLFKSGLLLANVNDTYNAYLNQQPSLAYNDGVLTAYEAMNLNLSKTRLVVLSACESGLGDIKNGEGVFGLQRAFMVAGARNLITSLSKVDDNATKELMILFYENLALGNSIHVSLRNAQIELKKEYNDPKIWGSFLLIGSE